MRSLKANQIWELVHAVHLLLGLQSVNYLSFVRNTKVPESQQSSRTLARKRSRTSTHLGSLSGCRARRADTPRAGTALHLLADLAAS